MNEFSTPFPTPQTRQKPLQVLNFTPVIHKQFIGVNNEYQSNPHKGTT